MSKITNNAGLPEPLVEAVRRDPYTSNGSDTTVTTLLKPARAVALERLHKDEITVNKPTQERHNEKLRRPDNSNAGEP